MMSIFGKSKKEDLEVSEILSQIKSEIRLFLVKSNIPRHELEVTNIKVEEKSESCTVTIYLCNLGRLIGKNGEVVKSLSIHLSNRFEKKFFINAVESDLWK